MLILQEDAIEKMDKAVVEDARQLMQTRMNTPPEEESTLYVMIMLYDVLKALLY